MVNLEITAKSEQPTEKDLETITAQLGRNPRDVSAVAHRCPCGQADVVTTPPRLADGTPFPTFYDATCPKLTAAICRNDLRLHDLRHYRAKLLIESGSTVAVAAQALGHSSLILHRRYGHMESKAVQSAVQTSWR